MSRRGIAIEQLPPAMAKQAREKLAAELALRPPRALPTAEVPRGTSARASKYGAQRTACDGIVFDSKLEARRYAELEQLRRAGEVLWFVQQVPFWVALPTPEKPRGVKYRADFLVAWADGRITVEDTKGMDTDVSRTKRAVVEERYRIRIELLRRGNVA